MHSSRMHPARLIAVSPSMHCSGGCLLLGGVCLWSLGGCSPACTGADPPVNRMKDRCKNIILPQTSFAGGNNLNAWKEWEILILNLHGCTWMPSSIYLVKAHGRAFSSGRSRIFLRGTPTPKPYLVSKNAWKWKIFDPQGRLWRPLRSANAL